MKGYFLDTHPDANVSSEHFALVNIPNLNKKRKRNRCPESQVQLMTDKEHAMASAKLKEKWYPAKVIGPARSSEGLNLYYIVEIFL
ncbi:MAG: hypothetical protein HQL46_07085 [Gammaproteobacteria bacterium]|nr:hypothetical protein [Gammaproteobacteria bacterium]